jgi:dolichol-phosphate mannosyltransferase
MRRCVREQLMRVIVVMPTYNEAGNIARIVPEIFASCAGRPGLQLGILVVDDNSPDGTAGVVASMQAQYPELHLITGEKNGLGAAYIRGMNFAIATLAADVVCEMDSDFSHKPSDLPRLLLALEAGADVVIGSRYVPGGSIPQSWGLLRRANSRVGNLVAQLVAGLYPIRDCTAGFRAIRGETLRRVNLGQLGVQGYAFQVALLHELKILGARIVEFPVEFVDRTIGESKLGLSDIVEFVISCWWIRYRSSKTLIKFLLVGATGVVVNLGVFWVLLQAGIGKYLASPIAVELSILSNFVWNNSWTFRHRTARRSLAMRALTFNAVSMLALCVSFGTFTLGSWLMPATSPLVLQFASIIPATLVNYYGQSSLTFG